MVKPLTVYKASAGSGKTFTLAIEYIKLLVQNPASYRNILAVTFTNKATEEMKVRILSQLYGIWQQLDDSEPYMQKTLESTGLTRQQASERAGQALRLLLHNYNYFRVETIDTFFQSVLRNLARELDLTNNLRIGLNDTQVEEEAVDQLIDSLTRQDVMLQWVMKYIMETISDDRSWNIIGQVKSFGRTIFRDYYKEQSKALHEKTGDAHFFEAFTRQLRTIRQHALDHMTQFGNEFQHILESESLTVDDLQYGRSGVAGFFLKLQAGTFDESIVGKRVADAMGDAAKWCKKSHPRALAIQALADSRFIPLLRQAIDERPRQWKLYKSADLTLAHLNQLRLLSSIEQKVRELNETANRFLLSDTQQLLHSLIDGSDSPFIFEKIGTQLEHVMIDEFQDTSTVQWKNFKVLLQECMSHRDSENLIVGDVKQSIYRWRSGDWRLLNAIEQEFPHADELMDVQPLETNYRSERNIVTFNNAFFTEAARQEYNVQNDENPAGAEQLRHAYADVCQQVPDDRTAAGEVSITLLPAADYQARTLQLLTDTVQRLTSEGIEPRRMAILVRTNHLIPLIADYFAHQLPEVRIVSDEAYRLDASPSVTLLVTALHLLTHPDDQLARATLAKLYHVFVVGDSVADSELLLRDRPVDALLPDAFTTHTDELLRLPLYELTERLYAIFQLHLLADQSAYVCAFFDQLSTFTLDNSTDIDAFLREWEDTIGAKTIQSDELDGVRILSIHKSKGLEFDNVIIPFCDWRMEHADILWCQPQEAPFDALPIAPIDYSEKQMRGTIYEADYLDEHLQLTVDNLNLLYVAFTRAAQNLFVIGRRDGAANTRSALVQDVLTELSLDGATLDGMDDDEAPLTFSYGQLCRTGRARRRETRNVFLQPAGLEHIRIETFANKTEFRQSNKSRDFISGDDEQQELSYIKMGSILHDIFSTIRTTADVDRALLRLQADGVIYDDDITAARLSDMLHQRLDHPRVREWFSPRWQLFNECTILSLDADGHVVERRPDRVMTDGRQMIVVDFKFGRPKPEYHDQVRQYMQLLHSMGHAEVSGYLWYVYTNKIEEVAPTQSSSSKSLMSKD